MNKKHKDFNLILLNKLSTLLIRYYKKMKKDYKAYRLYIKLSKANTQDKIIKAQEKIRDYFFNKRNPNFTINNIDSKDSVKENI
jgi:hypothetical protein